MANEKNDEEGPRSFIRFLADLGDGMTARDLAVDLRKMERDLHDQAIAQGVTVKGELVLKLKFSTEKNGVCTVKVESKLTLPKMPTSSGIMWHDPKTGHLSASNPKQLELGKLREVVGGKRAASDEDDDSGFGS